MAESTDPRRQAALAHADDHAVPVPPPAASRPSLIPADPTRDLAGALHEVSNALTVVIGWLERAREAQGSPGEVERALDVASARASQARAIVRQAIGAGDGRAQSPPATVGSVVSDAVTGLEPALRRAGVGAVVSVSPRVIDRAVEQGPTVLQILTNLLLNAMAMSPAGAEVLVEAFPDPSPDAGGVVFTVTDQGPGVPPERRATLFHAGVSTRPGGAGVGLRHAAALARSLGGLLALGETGPDGGARFELTWPLDALPPPTPLPPPPESGAQTPSLRARSMPLAGTRILLVEDDDAVVDLLDTALTARGADVVSIRHRRELAGALSTGRFDAALFDISPIQEDVRGAVELARGGREPSDALRVVLISGSAAHMPEMPDEWVAAWVRKPFEIGEILHAIEPASAAARLVVPGPPGVPRA